MKTNKPRKNSKKRWSVKYKKSINCSNPKGFSQKQYCKRKKRGGKYLTEKNKLLQNAVSSGCSCNECYTPEQNFGMLLIDEDQKSISENLKYHIDNNIPLHENIFRIYSKSYYLLINEVRDLYNNNEILLSPIDRSLIETDIGKYVILKSGKKIYLDSPFEIAENSTLSEAKYKNRNVKLNKPFRTPGGPKKFAVYVKDPKTDKVKIVRFGDPNLKIRSNDPKRAKSFRARHRCDQKKDRTTAGYWSCNVHRYRKQLGIKSKNPW
jgi:hypothetical protein